MTILLSYHRTKHLTFDTKNVAIVHVAKTLTELQDKHFLSSFEPIFTEGPWVTTNVSHSAKQPLNIVGGARRYVDFTATQLLESTSALSLVCAGISAID